MTITDITSIFAMVVSVAAFLYCLRCEKNAKDTLKLVAETNDDVAKLANIYKDTLQLYLDAQEKIRKIFQLSSGKEMAGQQPGEMVKVSEYH